MTTAEKIAEWRKGCSCSGRSEPEKCEECTKALIDSIERENVDYRALLVKYMALIIDYEGTAYLGGQGSDMVKLTDEDLTSLKALEPEAFDLFNGRE